MEYLKGFACLLFLVGVIVLIFAVPYVATTLAVVGVIVAVFGAVLGRMWLRLARR